MADPQHLVQGRIIDAVNAAIDEADGIDMLELMAVVCGAATIVGAIRDDQLMGAAKTFFAWAVADKATGALRGRYYYLTGATLPPSAEGCVAALFKTRREAREAAKSSCYPGRAVKVRVTIEVVG